MIKNGFFTITFLFVFLFSKEQTPPPPPSNLLPTITQPSPEFAAFARYGNYDVNLFNGTPNISIPIYEINVGDLKLPITINYNASGVRVNEVPTNIGLGWSLSAGGAITRKIMGGMADEYQIQPNNAGGFGYLNGNTAKNLNNGTFDAGSTLGLAYLRNVADKHIADPEPDIFSYSIPGKSGKFVFSQEQNMRPFLIPYEPIIITNKILAGPSAMSFGITNESGTNFQFNTFETSQNSGQAIQANFISSWLLTKMATPDRLEEINFNYSDGPVLSQTLPNENLTVIDGVYNTAGYNFYTPTPNTPTFGQPSITLNTYTSITQKNLDSIVFRNGKIEFVLAPESRLDFKLTGLKKRMQKILIYNRQGNTYTLIREFDFVHSYFIRYSSYPNAQSFDSTATRRLRLDSLIVKDGTGARIQIYKFDYNSRTDNFGLPEQNAKAIDFWGYYNGKFATSLIPRTDISYAPTIASVAQTVSLGASSYGTRDPDPAFMQSAILNKITYPTGGYTVFSYETNQYSTNNQPANAAYTGGLRVKQIQSFDGISLSPVTKTYAYGENESGFGLKNFILDNYFFRTTQSRRYLYFPPGVGSLMVGGTEQIRTYLANPTMNLEPFDAAPVAYPYVTEYVGDAVNNAGKTIYQFNTTPDNISYNQFIGATFTLTNHFHRGQILFKSDFRQNADKSYSLVSQVENHYSAFPDSIRNFSAFSVTHNIFSDGTPVNGQGTMDESLPSSNNASGGFEATTEYAIFNYGIQNGDGRLTQTINRVYDQFDLAKIEVTTKNLYYTNPVHKQITRTTEIDSRFDTLVTCLKYPADYLSGLATTNAVLDTMLYYNIQNPVIERWDSVKTFGLPNLTGVRSGQLNKYRQIGTGFLKLDLQRTIETTGPLTNFSPSVISSGNLTFDSRYKTALTYDNYDARGNVLQFTGRDGIINSFAWGYDKLFPVVKALNAVNTSNVVASQISTTGNLNLPPNNFAQQSTSFTNSYPGTISVSIPAGSYLSPGNIKVSGQFTLNGPGVSQFGTLCRSSVPSACTDQNIYTFNNMPAGSYILTFNAFSNNATAVVPIQYTYQGVLLTPVGMTEFFYESFEENTASQVVSGNAYTGTRYFNGSYLVPFTPPSAKNYILQYWSYSGGSWQFNQQTYSINTTLTGLIDEVRVFPSDAQMTSYTYTPLVGMTSMADPNAKKVAYEYDAFQRLKNTRDYQGNIIKNYQYNYSPSCVGACVVPMQTFSGTATPGYPVGVFSVTGNLIGNAATATEFKDLWNSNADNQAIGTLTTFYDPMLFVLTVTPGNAGPGSVIGCRYYQYDLPSNRIDAIRNLNGCYVDFGDGNKMKLGKNLGDVDVVVAPNTTANVVFSGFFQSYEVYWIHTYPNSSTKTITLYHNDDASYTVLDNYTYDATNLNVINNLRGNIPQNMPGLVSSCFQQTSALSVASITNWNSINSITWFQIFMGDGVSYAKNLGYSQDFMANNINLKEILLNDGDIYGKSCIDPTFKVSRLKSNWNTYFTNLQRLIIDDDLWNREDLSYLVNLRQFHLFASNQNHSNVSTNNPPIPIPGSVIDNIISQIGAGAGRSVVNGSIYIQSGGTSRSSASDNGLSILKSKGWTITINGLAQ